jgi:hypothetical protein
MKMAKIVYDAVATIGKYTDKNGNEKKRYVNVGKVFESENGLSLKLDAIPVGQEWTGWISFFVPKEREQQGQDQAQSRAPAASKPAPAKSGVFDDFDNDLIPF